MMVGETYVRFETLIQSMHVVGSFNHDELGDRVKRLLEDLKQEYPYASTMRQFEDIITKYERLYRDILVQ